MLLIYIEFIKDKANLHLHEPPTGAFSSVQLVNVLYSSSFSLCFGLNKHLELLGVLTFFISELHKFSLSTVKVPVVAMRLNHAVCVQEDEQ